MVMEEITVEESVINDLDVDLGEDEGNITCTKHHPDNHPGEGICAICLQEKLGNLVSSSLPIAHTFPTSSSSTKTFRHSISTTHRKPPRIPFLPLRNPTSNTTSLQRSKSTAATSFHNSQRKGSFWSFLYSSSSISKRDGLKFNDNSSVVTTTSTTTRASSVNQQSATTIVIAEEEDDEEDEANSPRVDPRSNNTHMTTNKVSRSRSVGCGGRSFSGDFFERLGDCTIRRVESQRQSSVTSAREGGVRGVDQQQQQKGIKERVRCGGFNLMSSSSSSSSDANSRIGSMNASSSTVNGRSRSWAWALASPLRAFAKPTSTSTSNNNNNHNRVPSSILSTSNR